MVLGSNANGGDSFLFDYFLPQLLVRTQAKGLFSIITITFVVNGSNLDQGIFLSILSNLVLIKVVDFFIKFDEKIVWNKNIVNC